LQEPEKAKESLNTVLMKSTSPNLFGLHPPFQMDANFGATAGIAEMLLQSHAGVIHLLPALPKNWPTGEIKGLKARGGYTVDIKWNDGFLTKANIYTTLGGKIRIKYRKIEKTVSINPKEIYLFDPNKK
jgi:alpha-L-fucosidase 2